MGQGQADKAAPGVGIGVRRAFAGQVRQKEESLAAGRDIFGLFGQQVVNFFFGLFSGGNVGLAHFIAEPMQRTAGRKIYAHHVPFAPYRVAKGVHAALGIDFHLVAMDEHHAGGAYGRGKNAAVDDSVAHRPGGTIAGPAYYHAIGR